MNLNSVNEFEVDYSLLRKMVVKGKFKGNLQAAKDWIKAKGQSTGNKAEKEADKIAEKGAIVRPTKEDYWKDELALLYSQKD